MLMLLLVGLLFVIAQLLLVPLGRDLENDEAVYLSQVSRFTAPAPWEPHRAWGVPLLLLPVGLTTDSVLLMRVHLVLVSGVAVVLAFRPWLRVLPGATAPLAALLFSSTWVALFYASEASPNLYVALFGVAGVGFLARLLAAPQDRSALVGLVLATTCGALVRPTDSLWLALPGLALTAARLRSQWRTGSALLAGLVLGWAPWITESFLRFGGPLERYQEAQASAGSGLGFTLALHLRLLDGARTCCFGPDRLPHVPLSGLAWWVGLALLAASAPVLVRDRDQRRSVTLALVTGIAIALAYLVLTRFVVSRFLLPTYALLSVAAAATLVALAQRSTTRAWSRGGTLAVIAGLAFADLSWHASVASRMAHEEVRARAVFPVLSEALRARGIAPECELLGQRSQNVAYHLGCTSGRTGTRRDLRDPAAAERALQAGRRVGYLWRGDVPRNSYLRTWRMIPLPEAGGDWRVYVPPAASWSAPPASSIR